MRDADLAVVATPVATLPGQVEAVLGAGGSATVTDVGSTKGAVRAAASDPRDVGGHPVVARRRTALRTRTATCSAARRGS